MGAELELEWYIDPVAPSVIAPRVHGLTYNGSAQSAVAVAGSAEGGTMQYSLNGTTWSTAFPTVTNVGNYTLYYRVIGDKNHTDLPAAGLDFRVTVGIPSFTPPTARSITYSGIAQYLINAGSSSSGTTMLYRLGEDGEWSTTRPQGTYADDYTVYWKVDGGDNYGDVDGGAIVVTIGRRALTVTAKDQTITYGESIKQGAAYAITSGLATGDSLTSVVLTQSTTSVTDSGAITPSAAIISKSSTDVTINYTVTYADGVLVINKTAASVTAAPTARSLTYSGSAQTLIYTGAASGGTMWYRLGTSGEWSTALPTYTNASSSLTVYYYVKGDSNHSDSETASITASIVKRPLTVTAKAQTITYGESIATGTDQVTVNGLVSGHSLTSISLAQSTTNATTSGKITPSAAVVKDGSSNTVTSNYVVSYVQGALTINRAPSTITLSAYTLSVNAGSSDTITVTFEGSRGTRSVSFGDRSVATASLSGSTLTVTGLASGNATITVSVEGTTNYEAASATLAVTVAFAPADKSTYIVFSSAATFTLKTNNAKKNWDGTLYYSEDAVTWSVWSGATTISSSTNGGAECLYLRGKNNTKITGSGLDVYWVLTGSNISCSGNIETLLDWSEVESRKHPVMGISCFSGLFRDCKALITPPDLPATTLSGSCYMNMFNGTSLAVAPELPAMTLAAYCYANMFNSTMLTEPPELPATELAAHCYNAMFQSCVLLTSAPALPATTLSEHCYGFMFSGCSLLATPPKLPATVLAAECYEYMFQSCALTSAPALPSKNLASNCYMAMFRRCKSLTAAPVLPATALAEHCYDKMFEECTALTAPPALPATALATYCYYYMFNGCTSLTKLPKLSATKLQKYCYQRMFYGCTNIKLSTSKTGDYQYTFRIPASGTGTTASNALTYMFTNTGGTFKSTPTINKTYYTTAILVG